MDINEYDLTDSISDAEILSQTLPQALNETVIRFTFKSKIPTIFATLQHDQITIPAGMQEDRADYLWVFNIDSQQWQHLDLNDIDTAIDIDSVDEVDRENQ